MVRLVQCLDGFCDRETVNRPRQLSDKGCKNVDWMVALASLPRTVENGEAISVARFNGI
jgi:hypothetical protein